MHWIEFWSHNPTSAFIEVNASSQYKFHGTAMGRSIRTLTFDLLQTNNLNIFSFHIYFSLSFLSHLCHEALKIWWKKERTSVLCYRYVMKGTFIHCTFFGKTLGICIEEDALDTRGIFWLSKHLKRSYDGGFFFVNKSAFRKIMHLIRWLPTKWFFPVKMKSFDNEVLELCF